MSRIDHGRAARVEQSLAKGLPRDHLDQRRRAAAGDRGGRQRPRPCPRRSASPSAASSTSAPISTPRCCSSRRSRCRCSPSASWSTSGWPASRPRNSAKCCSACAAALGDDCRLLVTGGRLERATVNTAWFNALAPLRAAAGTAEGGARAPAGLARASGWRARASARAAPVLALIAERTEGNLLAAHQELQRLALLLPPGELDPTQVERIVLDSARYEIFGLVDAALAGETARCAAHGRRAARRGRRRCRCWSGRWPTACAAS